MDLSECFYVFLALCQTKPSLTKISKFVEVKVLNVFGNVLSICEGKKDFVSGISFFIRNNIYLILLPMLH